MALIEYKPALGLLGGAVDIDSAPTAGSDNLITSGAVEEAIEAAVAAGGDSYYRRLELASPSISGHWRHYGVDVIPGTTHVTVELEHLQTAHYFDNQDDPHWVEAYPLILCFAYPIGNDGFGGPTVPLPPDTKTLIPQLTGLYRLELTYKDSAGHPVGFANGVLKLLLSFS
jgi:hypothetical protein